MRLHNLFNLTEIATFGRGADAIPSPNVGPGVFTAAARISNPHYAYFNSGSHGYNIMEVTPESLICTMMSVSTIKQPTAQKSVLKRCRVPVDLVEIIDETPTVAPSSAGG